MSKELPSVVCKRCDRIVPEDPMHRGHPCSHLCEPSVKEREFQLIEKDTTNAQKTINQWRHEYDIEIVSVQASCAVGYVIIALWRTKK